MTAPSRHDPMDSARSSYLLGVTRWRTWVLRGILGHISRSAGILATYLANRSGSSGGAWPSVKRIREATRLGRRQIFRELKLLGPQGLCILGTVKGDRGRMKGNMGYLGPRLYWIEEPSEAAIEKAIYTAKALKKVSAAGTSKARKKYPDRAYARSGYVGGGSSGYMTCSDETKRGLGNGESLIRPPSGSPAAASPSGQTARKVEGKRALHNAPAYTPKQLERIWDSAVASAPLGKTDGASPAGGRVAQALVSPSEVSRISKRHPRCASLTRDRSTCQYPAGASGYCHRHEPKDSLLTVLVRSGA